MQTWLITGASRGLGRQLALAFAARGAQVLAVARDAGGLEALRAQAGTGRIVPVLLDLADAAAIRPALSAAIEAAGGLDGAINNAGIGAYKPYAEHDEAELLRILQVNLGAAMQICHLVGPWLARRGGGHLINIASDLARRPLANMAPYVASKHGLAGLSHSLLREWKPLGIKVTLVNPGMIDTNFGGGTEGTRDKHGNLDPAALAALIVTLALQPGSVVVDELTVHPLGQAEF
jgi:NAD(P)-dependent dehydrogenase (short-subunit alcohol dehydrogenase family)